jgi:uncharacterized damage-inducible protein DinB
MGVTAALPGLKQQFLDSFDRETATTLKLLRAYPTAQSEMRPHPTSMSARELSWIFVVEMGVASAAITDQLTLSEDAPPQIPPPPATLAEVIGAFESARTEYRALVERTPEDTLQETFRFYVGPKTVGDVAKLQFMWLMLNDSIHHRGQLSVYLRMTGSKVPSIYGPSRDEPWF